MLYLFLPLPLPSASPPLPLGNLYWAPALCWLLSHSFSSFGSFPKVLTIFLGTVERAFSVNAPPLCSPMTSCFVASVRTQLREKGDIRTSPVLGSQITAPAARTAHPLHLLSAHLCRNPLSLCRGRFHHSLETWPLTVPRFHTRVEGRLNPQLWWNKPSQSLWLSHQLTVAGEPGMYCSSDQRRAAPIGSRAQWSCSLGLSWWWQAPPCHIGPLNWPYFRTMPVGIGPEAGLGASEQAPS